MADSEATVNGLWKEILDETDDPMVKAIVLHGMIMEVAGEKISKALQGRPIEVSLNGTENSGSD